MRSWLADLLRAERHRLAGALGIGVISGLLGWSNLPIAGTMGMVLVACGGIGMVAALGLIAEEAAKSRTRRLSREVADHEEVERLRASMSPDLEELPERPTTDRQRQHP